MRVVERCASTEDRDEHLNNLKGKFLDRNYPQKLVEEQFMKEKLKDRKDLIFQDRKDKSKRDRKD